MRVNPTFTKELECGLSPEEFDQRATAFARCDEKLSQLEAEKDLAMKACKERIAEVEAERTKLRRIVLERKELREVTVQWQPHWPSNAMQLLRLDTRQIVESRTMTPDELQETLAYEDDDSAPETNGDSRQAGDVVPPSRQLGDGKRSKKRRTSKADKSVRA